MAKIKLGQCQVCKKTISDYNGNLQEEICHTCQTNISEKQSKSRKVREKMGALKPKNKTKTLGDIEKLAKAMEVFN